MYAVLNFFTILVFIFCYIFIYSKLSSYRFLLVDYLYMSILLLISNFILFVTNLDMFLLPLYFIMLYISYRRNKYIWKNLILNAFIFVVIEFIFTFIALIFNVTLLNIRWQSLSQILICLISCIVLIFVRNYISMIIKKNRIILDYYNKKIKIILMLFVSTSIMLTFYIDFRGSGLIFSSYKIDTVYLVTAYFIIMSIVCLGYIYYTNEIKFKRTQFENLKEYTEKLETVYKDMRKFRHDYVNILNSISGYLDEDDIKGLKKYFYNNIYKLDVSMEKNRFKLGLLNNIRIMEVKGLLSSKIIKAQELKLDVNIDIVEAIYRIDMEGIDLVRILGIIMDNAIEAAFISKDKKIEIGIVKKELSTVIVILNSFKGEITKLSRLFKEGYSLKGSERGLGLSNLKTIINDYNNVTLDTSVEDNIFKQCIYIDPKKVEA